MKQKMFRDRLDHTLAPDGGELVGVLEPGVEFEGTMKVAAGLVRINAHYKGMVQSEGTVLVGDRGEIEGEVHAKFVVVMGKVKGSVHGKEQIQILEHGVVLGDIFSPSLIVEPGAYFDGQCRMPAPANAPAEARSK